MLRMGLREKTDIGIGPPLLLLAILRVRQTDKTNVDVVAT